MNPAFTIKAFGAYVVATGVALLLAPNVLLAMFGAPEAKDGYVRLLGALAIVLGYYYWMCGSTGQRGFFKASIPGRVLFFVLGAGLFLAGQLPATILLFGLVDVAGAAWTFMALRNEAPAGAAPSATA